jgi:hypothetical protein
MRFSRRLLVGLVTGIAASLALDGYLIADLLRDRPPITPREALAAVEPVEPSRPPTPPEPVAPPVLAPPAVVRPVRPVPPIPVAPTKGGAGGGSGAVPLEPDYPHRPVDTRDLQATAGALKSSPSGADGKMQAAADDGG